MAKTFASAAVSVVCQCLQAGLADQAHFAVTPTILGSGEHVFRRHEPG